MLRLLKLLRLLKILRVLRVSRLFQRCGDTPSVARAPLRWTPPRPSAGRVATVTRGSEGPRAVGVRTVCVWWWRAPQAGEPVGVTLRGGVLLRERRVCVCGAFRGNNSQLCL